MLYLEIKLDKFLKFRRVKDEILSIPSHALKEKELNEKFNRQQLEEANSEARKLFDKTTKTITTGGSTSPTTGISTGGTTSTVTVKGELYDRKQALIKDLQNKYSKEQIESIKFFV